MQGSIPPGTTTWSPRPLSSSAYWYSPLSIPTSLHCAPHYSPCSHKVLLRGGGNWKRFARAPAAETPIRRGFQPLGQVIDIESPGGGPPYIWGVAGLGYSERRGG